LASHPGHFIPEVGAHGTHWIGRRMDLKNRCGRGGEEKKLP